MSFAATMSRAWRPHPRLSAPITPNNDNDSDTQTRSDTIPHPLDGRDIELDPLVLTPPALSTSAPDPQPSPVRPTFTLGRSATTRARRTDDDGLGQYSLLTLLRAHPENSLTPSLLASRALISLPAATVMAQTLAVVAMSLADPSVRARELGSISEAINRAEALVARLEARVHAHEGQAQITGPSSPTSARMGAGTGVGTGMGMGTGEGTGSSGKDAKNAQRQVDDMPQPKTKSSIPRPVPKHSKSTPPKIPPSAWRDDPGKETEKNQMVYGGKKRASPRSSLSSLSTSPSSLSSLGTTPPDATASSANSSQHVPLSTSNSYSPSPSLVPAARAKTPSPRTKSTTPTSTPMTSPSLLPTPHSPSLSRFARDIVETRRHGFTLTRARVALECYPRWKGCAVTLMTEVRVAMARIQAIEREARNLGV